jgi:hypothetical protein
LRSDRSRDDTTQCDTYAQDCEIVCNFFSSKNSSSCRRNSVAEVFPQKARVRLIWNGKILGRDVKNRRPSARVTRLAACGGGYAVSCGLRKMTLDPFCFCRVHPNDAAILR